MGVARTFISNALSTMARGICKFLSCANTAGERMSAKEPFALSLCVPQLVTGAAELMFFYYYS